MPLSKTRALYFAFRTRYGPPQDHWSLWCKRPKSIREKEEVMIGAILTQHTNWNNVTRAMDRLKRARLCSLKALAKQDAARKKRVASCIRSAGFYRQKTEYLIGLARFIDDAYGNIARMEARPVPVLRRKLLSLKGIGPETADSILLYALGKPVFVIDEYTRRLVRARKMTTRLSYDDLQKFFEARVPRRVPFYQDFHALIVTDGKAAGKN